MPVTENLQTFTLENFDLRTLVVDSQALKDNPLGDPVVRYNPVLVPREEAPAEAASGGWPVVIVLSGFTGNGPNSFNIKTFEENSPQVIDRASSRGEAPRAIYVFCDAMTAWGGSQFINSVGTGRYEDYIINDICGDLRRSFAVSTDAARWCVTGGSSGGYGALHLASSHPGVFGLAAALAPDGFFEASLLHDLYTALPWIKKLGGIEGVRAELASGKLMKRKESHVILNAVAMGLCYAPDGKGGIDFPVDPETGIVIAESWKRWKAHDPVVFLRERSPILRKLTKVFLEVGTRDQFQLQYAARQMRAILEETKVPVDYAEFEGGHFDLGERRPEVWKWLRKCWPDC